MPLKICTEEEENTDSVKNSMTLRIPDVDLNEECSGAASSIKLVLAVEPRTGYKLTE